MAMSLSEWHNRFENQARWTQPLRNHLYRQIKIEQASRVIEVGCGSGVILRELQHFSEPLVFGMDINAEMLNLAMRNIRFPVLFQADAHQFPISTACFDITLCHFLLLWVYDPQQVIREMKRITRPGGFVCVLAEPDYGGRIDFPVDLVDLGKNQAHALQSQGANPEIGRQLRGLLTDEGLIDVIAGVLGGQWRLPFDQEEWELEWDVLEYDLVDDPDFIARKGELKAQDQAAWAEGVRVLYVPTFYAWGKVPD